MNELGNNDNFTIRDFREEDYGMIAGLWELLGLGSPERGDTLETIKETLRIGGRLLVMEEISSGKICGTSWMTFDGRRILLHHFGIRPEMQGNGLSKSLLSASLRYVKEKGCQAKLEVHTSNYKAINLYKKFGFKHLGDFDVYILRDISRIQF
ncbi:MAG: GNAT family N-acetyltransferase [Bacteroidales bacterium]|nr:GNAT family N-acetyltransferase [Bacteroidales bacterium]